MDNKLREIEDVTEEELQETEVYILNLLEANANKQPPIYLSTLIRLYGGIKFRDSTIKRLTEENENLTVMLQATKDVSAERLCEIERLRNELKLKQDALTVAGKRIDSYQD